MDFLISSEESKDKTIAYIKRLPVEKRPYKCKVLAVKKNRTLKQNSYMWFLFTMIAQEWGVHKDYVHDFFCEMFLRKQETIAGHTFTRTMGTSEQSTAELSRFIEDMKVWCAAEEGILLPEADEVIIDDPFFD